MIIGLVMTKIVTIHQPNYLPWIGFFSKIKQADVFVSLDIVAFSKDSFTQRTRIRTPHGWTYLTIPIERKYYGRPINEVLLPEDSSWMEKHWKSLQFNYGKTSCFKNYKSFFEEFYHTKYPSLVELNENAIRFLMRELEIKTELLRASELGADTNLRRTDLLVDVLTKTSADSYLSGKSGEGYLEKEKFREQGIELVFQRFEHPTYTQRFDEFVPNLSIIDLLFNIGEKAKILI